MDSTDAYESHAAEFLRNRDRSPIGSKVVGKWARTLRSGSAVIELGCGGGYPITQVLHSSGLRLWAVDSSPTLVARFESRFPDVPIQCCRVQECTFFHQQYDGVIAIGLIFLLPEPDQCELIASVARMLLPGGLFLFTAPIERGDWVDMNTGLLCRSLGKAVYTHQLDIAGLKTVDTFIDAGDNNYYHTQRFR